MSFSPDNFDYKFMAEEIKSKGHEKVLDGLLKELDCSRYIENVGYPITYNCYAYDRTCWKFNYVLDDGIDKGVLSDERCADYRKRFETLDKENELFARNHPEIGKYKKVKVIRKKNPMLMLKNLYVELEKLELKTCLVEKLALKLYPKTVS